MGRFWQRGNNTHGSVASTGLIANNTIFANDSLTDNNQESFDAVLVALFLMGLSDQDDLTALRVFVADEALTPTASDPLDNDPEMRGRYVFGRGPVYFQPRSKILVRPNQELYLQSVQLSSAASARVSYAWEALLVTKPTTG